MKLRRTGPDQFLFQLEALEHQLLHDTLLLYPLVPPAHHRVGEPGTLPGGEELQSLLDAALAEQRTESRRQIQAFFKDAQQCRKTAKGYDLTLTAPQLDWLLQVLNDVRVGSWLILGEPEPEARPAITPTTRPYLLAMDVCAAYQSAFLAALGTEQLPGWE